MKFQAYLKRLDLNAKIIRLSGIRKARRHPKAAWILQDQSIKRHGGSLVDPVIVCGAGRIQGPWA